MGVWVSMIDVENLVCNNCGESNWEKILEQGKNGHKGKRNRNPTKKVAYVCNNCDKEGRIFEDGVDGGITLSGMFRGN